MNQFVDDLDIAEIGQENKRLSTASGYDQEAYKKKYVLMPEGDGYLVVRLLPPQKGKKFYCATRTHKVNGRNVHCPREMIHRPDGTSRWVDKDLNNPCRICIKYNEFFNEAQAKEDEGEIKEADKLRNAGRMIKPIERYYYNCIVRDEDGAKNVGPKVLSTGKTIHSKIIKAITGDDKLGEKPLGNIAHLMTGRDLRIVKQMRGGKDAYPNYDLTKFEEVSALGKPEEVEQWLAALHDLAAERKIMSTDEMSLLLKKHLKIIPNEDTKFNDLLAEFRTPLGEELAEQVKSVSAKPIPKMPVKEEKATEALTEADFMAEIEELRTLAE